MITSLFSHKPLSAQSAEALVVCVPSGDHKNNAALKQLQEIYPPLLTILEQRKFSGSTGSVVSLALAQGETPRQIIVAGMGSSNLPLEDRVEHYRRAIGAIMRSIESAKLGSLALLLPDHQPLGVSAHRLAHETITTAMMAVYHFDEFITDESRKHRTEYTLTFVAPELFHDELKTGAEIGTRVGFAVNQARHWCDLPPVVLTPTALAEHARRIAHAHSLKVEIFTEAEIIAMGMGGIEAVAKGSDQEARMVIMEYRTEDQNAPTIALVGKGITFDSGGLSIKPATAMESMKDDMAGAAAVISTMEALAHLKPHINVIALAPITENLISGHATKPGDIIQFYNGKTAEVKNTDAEGRLILADALSYAVRHYKLDAIINIATLTGSCAYAIGPFFGGLMSKHEELSARLLAAAKMSGDRLWPLPFHDDYKPAVRSTVADLCNSGNPKYRAGAITAGFFLKNFVDDVPWVHLDVAGTSFDVPDMPYFRPGATGFGVRLFIDLITHWSKNQ